MIPFLVTSLFFTGIILGGVIAALLHRLDYLETKLEEMQRWQRRMNRLK